MCDAAAQNPTYQQRLDKSPAEANAVFLPSHVETALETGLLHTRGERAAAHHPGTVFSTLIRSLANRKQVLSKRVQDSDRGAEKMLVHVAGIWRRRLPRATVRRGNGWSGWLSCWSATAAAPSRTASPGRVACSRYPQQLLQQEPL